MVAHDTASLHLLEAAYDTEPPIQLANPVQLTCLLRFFQRQHNNRDCQQHTEVFFRQDRGWWLGCWEGRLAWAVSPSCCFVRVSELDDASSCAPARSPPARSPGHTSVLEWCMEQ
jgi:hypothetical protein